METELQVFLKDNDEFEMNSYGKVHCKVTNHDIVAKMDEVRKHMQSDKYLRCKNWCNYDYTKYAPYIIEHNSNPKKLYCILTKTEIGKIPEVIEKLANSKKYKRLQLDYERKAANRAKREENRKKRESKEGEEENSIDDMLESEEEKDEFEGDDSPNEDDDDEVDDFEGIDEFEDVDAFEDEELLKDSEEEASSETKRSRSGDKAPSIKKVRCNAVHAVHVKKRTERTLFCSLFRNA